MKGIGTMVARGNALDWCVGDGWRRLYDPANLGPERIDDANAGVGEIGAISCDDRQAVNRGRRGDQTVLDRHGFAGDLKRIEPSLRLITV